ncbi:hypothetical protein M8C21_009856, partial [Ambrosia artemisiifolia]
LSPSLSRFHSFSLSPDSSSCLGGDGCQTIFNASFPPRLKSSSATSKSVPALETIVRSLPKKRVTSVIPTGWVEREANKQRALGLDFLPIISSLSADVLGNH